MHTLHFGKQLAEFYLYLSTHNPTGHPVLTVYLNGQPMRIIFKGDNLTLELPLPNVGNPAGRLAGTDWQVSSSGTAIHTAKRIFDVHKGDDLNQTIEYAHRLYTKFVKAIYLPTDTSL